MSTWLNFPISAPSFPSGQATVATAPVFGEVNNKYNLPNDNWLLADTSYPFLCGFCYFWANAASPFVNTLVPHSCMGDVPSCNSFRGLYSPSALGVIKNGNAPSVAFQHTEKGSFSLVCSPTEAAITNSGNQLEPVNYPRT